MTLETRSSALDPFLTMRSQHSLLMDPPSPQLLIDGDNLTVTNALDRTDDPAVLITGSNNIFVNQTGATLTGTGTGSRFDPLDGAIEITGTGNQIENQLGAVVIGVNGIVGTGSGNSVFNDGDVLSSNFSVAGSTSSTAISLGIDADVQNTGVVKAEAFSFAGGIVVGESGTVDNSGMVVVSGGNPSFGINTGPDGVIVNSGDVLVTASGVSVGLTADSSGSTIQNSGAVRVVLEPGPGHAIGIGYFGDNTVWNGGTIEAIAANGGNAIGIEAVIGGSADNDGTINASATGFSYGMLLDRAVGSNAGTITSSSDSGEAIGVGLFGGSPVGAVVSFSNSGDILATGSQAIGVITGFQRDLTNTGTITATGSTEVQSDSGHSVGVELRTDTSIENLGSVLALANAEVVGIDALDHVNIRNDGLVGAANGAESSMGIQMGSDGAIINAGAVIAHSAVSAIGISVGNIVNIESGGLLEASGASATGISAGDGVNIQNSGVLEASGGSGAGAGIQMGSDGTIANSGTVLAQSAALAAGISAGDRIGIQNSGLIEVSAGTGSGTAIQMGSDGTIANSGTVLVQSATSATGLSVGDRVGFQNDGVMQVSGGTESGTGIQMFSDGTIANTGTLLVGPSTVSTGISAGDRVNIQNTGVVEVAGTFLTAIRVGANSTIVNSGTILYEAGEFADGVNAANSSTIQNDGVIQAIGPVAFGMGVGPFGHIANTGSVDVSATSLGVGVSAVLGSTMQNFGTVHLEALGVGATGFGVEGFDSVLTNAGTIDVVADDGFVTGLITGGAGSRVENSGLISSASTGTSLDSKSEALSLQGGSGLNTGSILASAVSGTSTGAVLGFGSQLTNAGDIAATGPQAVGVALGDGTGLANGGIVAAIGTGARAIAADAGASVVNDGAILALALPAGEPSVGIAFDSTIAAQKTVVNNGVIAAEIAISDNTAAPSPETDTLTVDNTGLIAGSLDLGNGIDVVTNTGAIFGDVDLGSGNDVFDGRGGVVVGTVDGAAGDDIIHGGICIDTLFGGTGDDLLDGGGGDDLLTGGGGDDLFTFGLDGGNDRIFDFQAGVGSDDAVDLTAFDTILSFDDVLGVASQTSGDGGAVATVLTFDATTTLTFEGVRLADLNETDFIIV